MSATFKYDPSCEASTPYMVTRQQIVVAAGIVAIRINEYTTISLTEDEYESIVETANILPDAEMMKAIKSDQDSGDANVIPWEVAKRRLGL